MININILAIVLERPALKLVIVVDLSSEFQYSCVVEFKARRIEDSRREEPSNQNRSRSREGERTNPEHNRVHNSRSLPTPTYVSYRVSTQNEHHAMQMIRVKNGPQK
jgi:hypothetical protein